MKVKLRYNYTGSSEFEYVGNVSDFNTPIFSLESGINQIEFLPIEGTTVEIEVPNPNTGLRTFDPNLNNAIYYLLTNNNSPSRDDVLNFGIALSISNSDGYYRSSFTFNNPDGYTNLFLVVDSTNTINISDTLNFTMGSGEIKIIDGITSSGGKIIEINYQCVEDGNEIFLEQNGSVVFSTGIITALGTGSIKLKKITDLPEEFRIIIKGSSTSGDIELTYNEPLLTEFYIDLTDGEISDVCSQVANTRRYHNGLNTLPVEGDFIYTTSLGDTKYNGGNFLHVVSPTIMVSPSSSSIYIGVDLEGKVLSTGSCVCSELAVPVINQGDIVLKQDEQFSIAISATNNPFKWQINTSCTEYRLSGGIRGAVFSYKDCDSVEQNIAVGINGSKKICTLSDPPSLISGTGVFEEIGKCTEGILPEGLTFRDGLLFGIPSTPAKKIISLIASNCFGDSVSTDINVIIQSALQMKPFAIITREPKKTNADACTIPTADFELLYHNGKGDIPMENDVIYVDQYGINVFVGGDLWYNINNGVNSVQIDPSGVVKSVYIC